MRVPLMVPCVAQSVREVVVATRRLLAKIVIKCGSLGILTGTRREPKFPEFKLPTGVEGKLSAAIQRE